MNKEIKKNKNDKLSFLEFLNTVKWLLVYNVKLSPFVAISRAAAFTFLTLNPLINAYIFARLLDIIIKIIATGQNLNGVLPVLGILLSYNLITSGVNYANGYLQNAMFNLTVYKSPQLLYKHIHSLGIQTLENPEVVNKIQRSKEVLGMLNNDFDSAINFLARIITLIIASLVVVKAIPIVVAVIFVSMIPGFISNRFYMKKSWQLYRDETENRRKANFVFGSLTETSNLQEITITSAYKYLSDIYKKFADYYVSAELKNIKSWQFSGFLFGSITAIASIFGYFTILKNLFKKIISIGDVTFQMRSLDIFINNLSMVGNGYASLSERCVRINEIKEVFDMKPIILDGELEIMRFGDTPNIKFEKVSFKYPNSDKHVIKNLNLEIKPGEKVAIVGENGAGKTTLVKLLCRFYKVDNGKIYLNKSNINNIKINNWYKNLGVLFQDFNTYGSLTLKENIYLGRPSGVLDENKMEFAVNKANVNSFLTDLKRGYDQTLSEKFKGGTRPSSGQWQKIAIARFFYRDSSVVIFDEPTASIDAISESEIFNQIYDFFKNKTVIIISHRFSTVRNADKIYVLDKGEIIEKGSHNELMELRGKYYKAFNIQAKGYR